MKKKSLDMIEWDDYRIFLIAARTESLSGAAKFLRLDHSTVSRRIAQLELCLGSAVFERHRQGLRLTELGQQLQNNVERMESSALEFRETLGDMQEPAGRVRIAMMEGIGSLYLSRRLLPLIQKYPKLQIELITAPQTVNVDKREADAFLSFFRPQARGLHSEQVGKIGLTLYAAEKYLEVRGKPQSIEELREHHFVTYVEQYIQVDSVRWLDGIVEAPEIVFRSNSMIAQMSAAASGAGLVLLPRFSVENEPLLLPVLEDKVHVKRELWISVPSDLQNAKRIRAVTHYLAELLLSDQEYLNGPFAESSAPNEC